MSNNSINYNSLQASNYRSQGMDKDAELREHFVRREFAESIGGDGLKEYKEASRRYSEYVNQGRTEDAERQKRFMDVAMLKMMGNK